MLARRISRSNYWNGDINNLFYQVVSKPVQCTSFSSTQLRRIFSTSSDRNQQDLQSKLSTVPIDIISLQYNCSQDDIANALRSSHAKQTPVLLQGAVAKSDAIQLWKSLDYLETVIGKDEACLVEIGGNYSNPGTERPEIAFGDYLQYMKLVEKKGEEELDRSEMVYLAQNELFQGLMKDFTFPELCRDESYNVGEGKLYNTMFWFGPKGCVSPLHFDPLDNLLMQFIGRKRVILYPPEQILNENDKSLNLYYAGFEGQQYNTSPIDVDIPDNVKYPNFALAPTPIECLLTPGDILFMPSKWWHHVKSLETAISVNVWWR